MGLQLSLEDFLRACLKRTVRRCSFGVARVSVRQCDVTEAVKLSDRDRRVTMPRYKRGFAGNKDQLLEVLEGLSRRNLVGMLLVPKSKLGRVGLVMVRGDRGLNFLNLSSTFREERRWTSETLRTFSRVALHGSWSERLRSPTCGQREDGKHAQDGEEEGHCDQAGRSHAKTDDHVGGAGNS